MPCLEMGTSLIEDKDDHCRTQKFDTADRSPEPRLWNFDPMEISNFTVGYLAYYEVFLATIVESWQTFTSAGPPKNWHTDFSPHLSQNKEY